MHPQIQKTIDILQQDRERLVAEIERIHKGDTSGLIASGLDFSAERNGSMIAERTKMIHDIDEEIAAFARLV